MDNGQFLKLLLEYWQPSIITFKINEDGFLCLGRDENDTLFAGHTFDEVIDRLRKHFSELYLTENKPQK